ncbi:unnamed protein product [Caenorhabditis bovis]|uniref:Pyridine nucleotide-disulfide oxidoreductase domain-containing protein 2 n=1 Tax=Caenorhabditis bovis TaxID=2654633 RepID=A0A8S1F222_9PELO|nr:unnamed protein product [Caenorhabditis bovis]
MEDCKNHKQKNDCWELAKCMFGNDQMLPEKEVLSFEEVDLCENASTLVLREPYTILRIPPNKLFRLQIDRSIGDGEIISANYTFNGAPVEQLAALKECELQAKRLFSSQMSWKISRRCFHRKFYDAIIVGGGHNGLTAAAYLAKAGKSVVVLERRHILGGAACTEQIIPGFRFSRASYLLSLLRPAVIQDLDLKNYGLKYHIRNPNSFTPIRDSRESLLLGMDMTENQKEIAKFSKKDAEMYPKYEHFISEIVQAMEPLMDHEPLNFSEPLRKLIPHLYLVYRHVKPLGFRNAVDFYELMTAPISKIMNKWFESDVLKATLGTDGVIGFAASPLEAGTGYVLLHHVIGGLDEHKGAWGYVYGGMGAVSQAIADFARSRGAELYTDQEVDEILIEHGVAKGVRLANGQELHAKCVLSNATPHVTFNQLVPKHHLSSEFYSAVNQIDYTSPVTKINVAVKELPNFVARPNQGTDPMPHHQTTIHMNCESMQLVHEGVMDYRNGRYSRKPVIEMTIPSSVDRSLVDGDGHVVLLFTQYTPYSPTDGEWTEEKKKEYAKHVFSEIDAYAPNFSSSIIGYDILTPPDIEKTFGITGGNIFHGSMGLDQLYITRPLPKYSNYSTPIQSLFLCGSGAHPGGGVTGAPGRLGAQHALQYLRKH